MGTKTLTTFLEDIKVQFGNNTAFATPTDFYTRWFNSAYIRLTTQDHPLGIKNRIYFPQLETSTTDDTVDGTAYVSVPSDALIIRQVYDTDNNRRLKPITAQTYIDYTDRANTSAEGPPTQWVRQGSYIYLHPTPDDAYTLSIYYREIPDELSTGSSTTAIGTEWDEPLVTLAAYIGKMQTMDYEKAKILKEDFREQVEGIITIYGEEDRAREEFIHLDYQYRDGSY